MHVSENASVQVSLNPRLCLSEGNCHIHKLIIIDLKNVSVFFQSFGYFDFQVQTCKQTGGNKSLIDYTDLKVRKVGGERKLFGNVTFHIPMDNSFDVERYAYMKQGGEYRRLPFKIVKKKFCDFFVEEKLFYPDFVKVSDFPPPDITLCPLKNVRSFSSGHKVTQHSETCLNLRCRKLITFAATNHRWTSFQKRF